MIYNNGFMEFWRTGLGLLGAMSIKNNKIIDHWLIADQMILMEQLGVVGSET
ncbi:MAG: hypothetical protein IPL46_18365 [Saprospiraceae bacterium]|nr:hypothetical protein [Saprospiraceae bacterium]